MATLALGLLAFAFAALAPGRVAQAAVAPTVTSLGSLAGEVDVPNRVAADPNGNLYVVDTAAGRVELLDAFGRVLLDKSGFRSPLGIAVDAEGNIYLGEAGTGAVNMFNSRWVPLLQLGIGDGEFKLPSYIAVDNGTTPPTVYVSDSAANVVKVYRSGARVGSLGGPGSVPTGFSFPAGVWVNAAGEVFAADQNQQRVLVYSRAGAFLRAFLLGPAYTAGASGRPSGITGDAQGRVYVADTFQDYVKVFDGQGTLLSTISGYGYAPGQLRSPGGLTIDPQGRLLVASPNNGRVEMFGVDCFTQLAATPSSQTAAVGATVTFSAAPLCGGPFTYQWRKGTNELADGGVVSGATNGTLTLAGVTTGDAGAYSVTLTGANGAVASPAATLSIIAAPVITTSPLSRNAAPGSNVVFTAAATGSNLVWRWFYNGMELFLPNTNTLVLTNVQYWNAGKYWVMATNLAGSATSAQATLAVLAPPTIVSGPTNLSVAERGTATFTVAAGGSTPYTYQWYLGPTALAGRTAASLVLTNVIPPSNGTYSVRVSNLVGFTNSGSATLTVLPDTVKPAALVANGGPPTSATILVSFSEPVDAASAQQPAKYQLMGPGDLSVVSAAVTNASKVLLTLSGNRDASGDYALRVQDILDTAYTPNLLSPNPTTLSVSVSDSFGSVAWWPLDEGSGTLARDATGNGFDGTVEKATWAAGRMGSSISLDGTNGDVVIPALNLFTNTVTISGWIRRTGTQSNTAGIFFCRAGSTIAGLQFGATNDLRYNWNNASAATGFSSRLVPTDAAWNFVALVIEPSQAVFYLNSGSGLRSATNVTTHGMEEFNGVSYIGYDTSATNRHFKGAVDDVRICNRALSATEVQALYNAVATPATISLTLPANGSTVPTPNPTLLATVTPNGNPITKVEFYSGGVLLGSARTAPYSMVWSNLANGSYSVQARLWYGPANYSASSSTFTFTVAIPFVSSLTLSNGVLNLEWSGGVAPYQVQTATNLGTPDWQNLGPETSSTSLSLPVGDSPAYFRIVGH